MEYSLYVHIPFCSHRCAYCDFNTYAGQEGLMPAYVEALCREVEWVGRHAPTDLDVHTVYFGGGTPSLMTPAQFKSILRTIGASFRVSAAAEITVEANPGTVSKADLGALRRLGINRLSLGVQSANGEELRLLQRTHTYFEVLQAVANARRAGFDNVSVDLIYGLPEQSLQTWQTSTERVLRLEPDHISAYSLTLEHGTPFSRWAQRGLMVTPDPDEAADMYEWLTEALAEAGFQQYEISNWARPGKACRHNLQYWRGLPYIGVGAGAHGYANGRRYSNVRGISAYSERMESASVARTDDPQAWMPFPLSPAAAEQHVQTRADDMSEFMIMGLRLTREGISPRTFASRFGVEPESVFGKQITDLREVGLLEGDHETGSLHLSRRGRLLGNQVFVRFV